MEKGLASGGRVWLMVCFTRKPMKTIFLLLVSLTVSATALAADTKPVEEVFQRYWGVYVKKDFAKAAAEILPSDLEATKAAVLPVFLAGQTSRSKDAPVILGAFFGKAVGKGRETMSAADVFAGLNRVVVAGNPEMFEAFKEAVLSIIFVRAVSADAAEVHFQITVRGESDTDVESLVRQDGRWWVRVKDDPKEAAANFKELFGK